MFQFPLRILFEEQDSDYRTIRKNPPKILQITQKGGYTIRLKIDQLFIVDSISILSKKNPNVKKKNGSFKPVAKSFQDLSF